MKKNNKPIKIRVPIPKPTKWHSNRHKTYNRKDGPCTYCNLGTGIHCIYCDEV